jgi:hypothetical protein
MYSVWIGFEKAIQNLIQFSDFHNNKKFKNVRFFVIFYFFLSVYNFYLDRILDLKNVCSFAIAS